MDPKARDRAYRRYQDQRRKKKIMWYYRDTLDSFAHHNDEHFPNYDITPYDEPNWLAAWIGRTASHNHSCHMCGGPRHRWGKDIITKQERLSEIDFRQQIQDLGYNIRSKQVHRFTSYYG